MTKYFSHASSALAGRQVRDGDVTEIPNTECSIAPFPDLTFSSVLFIVYVDPLRTNMKYTRYIT